MASEEPGKVWKTAKGDNTYWSTTEPKASGFQGTEKKLEDLRDTCLLTPEEFAEKLSRLENAASSEEVDTLEDLKQMADFLKRWKTLVTSTDSARSTLGKKPLRAGENHLSIKQAARVSWRTMDLWLYSKAPTRSEEKESLGKVLTKGVLSKGISKDYETRYNEALMADKTGDTEEEA